MESICSLVVVALALASAPMAAVAGDPDILTDFVAPIMLDGAANITGDYFTFTGFSGYTMPVSAFAATKATAAEFPALNGQSVWLMFPPGAVNPPHTHPRAAELLLVVDGSLSVGFVDTAGKHYVQELGVGDMFVFPKGLVHYQSNKGPGPAVALSAFGSAAPGTVSVPVPVFGKGVDNTVLAKSFKTDVPTVQKLKAALSQPAKKP